MNGQECLSCRIRQHGCDMELLADDIDSEVKYFRRQKRRFIGLLWVYGLLFGVICCFLPENDSQIDFLVSVPFLVFGILWCSADAKERGTRLGKPTQILLVLLFVVGFPLYVFRSRGLGGFKTLFLGTVVAAISIGLALLSGYATLMIGYWLGYWEFPA